MESEQQKTTVLHALLARLELDADLGAEDLDVSSDTLRRSLESLARRPRPVPSAPAPRPFAPVRAVAPESRPSPAESRSALPSAGVAAASAHVSLVPYEQARSNAEKEALLADIRHESESCARCPLSERRNNVVWGEGSLDADVMFIGEGPGKDEDIEGRPFVGRSGRLLTDIIEKGMRRPRGSVYIANVVKCRPPGNRDPRPDEVTACSYYLKKQIEVVNPAVIVAVGMVAARALLGLPPEAGGLRGQWHHHEKIPLRVIYHPSYLLRQRQSGESRTEADKATWQDIQEVIKKAAESQVT
jgi:DNA polymerase